MYEKTIYKQIKFRKKQNLRIKRRLSLGVIGGFEERRKQFLQSPWFRGFALRP